MTKRTLKSGRSVAVHDNDGLRKRCACGRSKWKSCRHPWHANYSHLGVEHRVSLHVYMNKPRGYVMNKTEAQGALADWIADLRNGRTSTPASSATPTIPTLDQIAARYLMEYIDSPDRRPSARVEMARQLGVLCRAEVPRADGTLVRLGALSLAEITKPVIEVFRLRRRQAHEAKVIACAGNEQKQAALVKQCAKAGRVATNRLLTRLRHVFAWSIGQDVITETPFSRHGVVRIHLDQKAETGRSRRLEGDERARLLAAAGPHLRGLIIATLETGLRRGELLGLRWADVKLGPGYIDLPETITKTGEARTALITPRLREVLVARAVSLDGRPAQPGEYVFGDETGRRVTSIKTAWKLTCQRAGIVGLHFHDLRREAGSELLESGASLHDVRDFLGHTSTTQTNTYLASSVARLKAALDARDQYREARTKLAQDADPDSPPPAPPDAAPAGNTVH